MNLANRDTLDAVVTSAVAFAASATGTDHHDDKTAVAHDVDNETILETQNAELRHAWIEELGTVWPRVKLREV